MSEQLFSGNPNHAQGGRAVPDLSHDITLRDYFAAKAMAAMLANSGCDLHPTNEVIPAAWKMADAMLKARQA